MYALKISTTKEKITFYFNEWRKRADGYSQKHCYNNQLITRQESPLAFAVLLAKSVPPLQASIPKR